MGFTSLIDQTLGHYRILKKLGEGGMGVVYKAQDLHLDRFVALKILPPEKITDAERKQRFVQEAKAASALNHPGIITIHDIASDGGMDFIVMEYVEGKTLDHLIPRKGMPVNEAVKLGVQIADALAAAHSIGIVHRDIKPSNIMVSDQGRVKVLDFGLVKLTETAGFAASQTAETAGVRTDEGRIVGTVYYMSPEQAQGKRVDARSDIFSFGAVLYEMITGRRAFQGDTRASTLAAILREEPKSASEIAPAVPRELERLIRRCLRKPPERRSQGMADLKVALEELKEESESGSLAAAISPKTGARRRSVWGITVAAILAASVLTAVVWRPWEAGSPEAPLSAAPLTANPGTEGMPSFSPDGNQLAFSWDGERQDNRDIYVKLIGGGFPIRLTTDPRPDLAPAWSPDGRWVAFVRLVGTNRKQLVIIPALGGQERKLAECSDDSSLSLDPFFGFPAVAWSLDSKWVAYSDRLSPQDPFSLFLVSLETGEKRRLTVPPGATIGDFGVAFSPEGRRLAFLRSLSTSLSQLYVLTLTEDMQPNGQPRQVRTNFPRQGSVTWTPDGTEIILCGNTVLGGTGGLWRVAASSSSEPRRLPFGENAYAVAVSRLGHRLVYATLASDWNIWRISVPAKGAAGPPVRLISSVLSDMAPQYAPDGKRIVFASGRSGHMEIWVCDRDGTKAEQLTSFAAHSGTPRWSPDSQRIVFDSNKEGRFQIYVVDATGGVPQRLTTTPVDDAAPSFSGDGKWIYFSSRQSGRWEVWKMATGGGETVQITRGGGFSPFESHNGKLVYYQKLEDDSEVWSVPAETGTETKVLDSVGGRKFAVTGSGIYFMTVPPGSADYHLRFFEFATKSTRDIAQISKPLFLGLTVSPDGQSVLYTQGDQFGSNLTLVENFR